MVPAWLVGDLSQAFATTALHSSSPSLHPTSHLTFTKKGSNPSPYLPFGPQAPTLKWVLNFPIKQEKQWRL